jgi:dTDP-glucose 4,6-dehydratase
MVRAYHHTFGLDVVTTRCSNNYGPFQFPEKLIPLMILHAKDGKPMPVYGNGKNVRDWIHVEDHCRGVLTALEHGKPGEVYNFGGESERDNLQIVQQIADLVCGHHDLIRFVQDRPGHDWRYAMDITKVRRELGWEPRVTFATGLADTIQWYLANPEWCRQVLSQEYRSFYDQWYAGRTNA